MQQYGGHRHPKTGWHEKLSKRQVNKRMKRKERIAGKKEIQQEMQ
jgi:hypothetical protein